MTGFAPAGSALIDQFTAFHAALAEFTGSLGEQTVALEVRDQLAAMIDGLAQGLDGRRAYDNGCEARYLMAAFADEVLIASEWEHQQAWIGYLLEEKLFGSRNAGDRVFSRIGDLLQARDPDRAELALPYMYALALGFRGRFGNSEKEVAELKRMRAALFKLANGRDPDRLFDGAIDASEQELARRLMPRAYRNMVLDATPVMLPNPNRWLGIFGCAVALMLVLAFFVWEGQTRALRQHFRQTAAPQVVQPMALEAPSATQAQGAAP
ncbi:MAG: DotU family type IV/VI secretion system protein [Pseudomonadota bacterium]